MRRPLRSAPPCCTAQRPSGSGGCRLACESCLLECLHRIDSSDSLELTAWDPCVSDRDQDWVHCTALKLMLCTDHAASRPTLSILCAGAPHILFSSPFTFVSSSHLLSALPFPRIRLRWVNLFLRHHQLPLILPFIPTTHLLLSNALYTVSAWELQSEWRDASRLICSSVQQREACLYSPLFLSLPPYHCA